MTADASTSRRPQRHDAASLVSAAALVFTERGYDGTSMEDLARAAGVTKSSIYHHVRGKEELLRLALERALGPLFAVLEEPTATSGPALARLEHVLRREVDVLVAELPHVTLLLRVRGNTATERWAIERRRAFDASVAELARTAVAEGDLRPDLEPALVTRLVFGMINSIAEWYRPDDGDGGAPGLRAPAPPAAPIVPATPAPPGAPTSPGAGALGDAVVSLALDGWRRDGGREVATAGTS